MKCLIVEDEFYVRRSYIRMGNWKAMDINSVFEANNGEEGLIIAEKHTPEIIITDMRMNVLDGSGFLLGIRSLSGYNPQIIVISGHDDYGYMRSALENQAVDYLLKPVNGEILNHSIKRAIDRHYFNQGNKISSLESFIRQLDRENEFVSSEEGTFSNISVLEDFFARYTNALLFIPYMFNFGNICKNEYRGVTDLLCLKIQHEIEQTLLLQNQQNFLILRITEGSDWNFVCLLSQDEMKHNSLTYAQIEECLEQIRQRILLIGIQSTISCSNRYFKKDEIETVYSQVRASLQHINLLIPKPIIFSDDNQYQYSSSTSLITYEPRLMDYFLSNQIEEVWKVIESVFNELTHTNSFYIYHLRKLWIELFQIILSTFVQYAPNAEIEIQIMNVWVLIRADLLYLDKHKMLLKQCVEQSFALLASNSKKPSQLYGEILNFIEEHFAEKITLADLSRQFYVSKEHICRVFQQESHKTFTTHLTECRLKHVRRYLLSTEYSLSSIALRTGFVDPNYLNRVFRKKYSVSPIAYRSSKRLSATDKP